MKMCSLLAYVLTLRLYYLNGNNIDKEQPNGEQNGQIFRTWPAFSEQF